MPTINKTIVAGTDDASESIDQNTYVDGSSPAIVRSNTDSGIRRAAGFRFTSVAIPPGATISSAVLSLASTTASVANMNADVYCHDVDNAPTFDGTDGPARRFNSGAITTATVSWVGDNLGTSYVSPADVAALVQEVVNRAGWASGNAIALLVVGKNATDKRFSAHAFEGGSSLYAKLDITYTTGGGPKFIPEALALNPLTGLN